MDLPSTYHFEGWNIKYNLATSKSTTSSNENRVKYVVFVHGTPWSSIVYSPMMKTLLSKPSYRILVYDLPGYGQSQEYTSDSSNDSNSKIKGFTGDTSVKFQAKALTALLEHVRDGQSQAPPAVIAHDIAGTIVLRAHLLHNVDFASMLLVDTNTVLPWGDGFYKLTRSEPQTFLKLPPDIFEAVVRAVTRSAVHDANVLKTGWEDELAGPWIGNEDKQRSFVRQIAQANDADVAEMLDQDLYASVRCDVKVVWGEQDQWIPRGKIEDLIKRLGDRVKDTAFIPEAGHLVMLDQPARFAVEAFDWVNRYGSS